MRLTSHFLFVHLREKLNSLTYGFRQLNSRHVQNDKIVQYAGTVMTSFDRVMIPTRGKWFRTNPLEHELDDRAGKRVSSVCITNG